MKPFLLYVILFVLALTSCKYAQAPDAVSPVPSARQQEWYNVEYYAFIHFGINTFTGSEWGSGSEDPALFNPSRLDCRQWVSVIKDAGMKGVILTAKHHDGFCLWPSRYTEYSIKNSPYKAGKGDIVKELSDACAAAGLKFGIYLSPWDRNHADYGKPEYITYFRNQLEELLRNYGPIFEVWFDGANGGTGWYGGANEERTVDRRTYYGWDSTFRMIRRLQPNACIFSDGGPDIRWVGNERGEAGETNWAMLTSANLYPGMDGKNELLQSGQVDGADWVAAEADVSIRPGWFYHASEDHQVKSVPRLMDIYYASVGRNASLLLNLPVNQEGLIPETDAARLKEFAAALKNEFSNPLSEKAKIKVSNQRGISQLYSPYNLVDGVDRTVWTTDNGVVKAAVTFDFDEPVNINRIKIHEHIVLGQRVSRFAVTALVSNTWKVVADGTTIGRNRFLRFETVNTRSVNVSFIDGRGAPVISEIGLYYAEPILTAPDIRRDQSGNVTITSNSIGTSVFYTTDGREPDAASARYDTSFNLSGKATVKAIVVDKANGKKSDVAIRNFDVSKDGWRIAGKFSAHKNTGNIFDGDPNTAFTVNTDLPAELIIDLGKTETISALRYLPDQNRWEPGVISQMEVYITSSTARWGLPVVETTFDNIKNSPILQTMKIKPTEGRYIRIRALQDASGKNRMGIAEFDIITE